MPSFLCVANFSTSTGYAWTFINATYGELARRAKARGLAPVVAYRTVKDEPEGLTGVPVVEMNARMDDFGSIVQTLQFVRRHDVRVVYFSDRRTWSWAFPLLRVAGVRRIVVHNHTVSGGTAPRGWRRLVKRARHFVPWCTADVVVVVSDYVAEWNRTVSMVPAERVHRVWNSIEPPVDPFRARRRLRDTFALARDQTVICCAARAFPDKGIPHLLKAFDQLNEPATLVYFGDGPAMPQWRELRLTMRRRRDVIFAGYRKDAPELIGGSDVAVVPSTCAEAFGMAALEPMAAGVPVIASDTGGLPEVVEDGVTGRLVPPGDADALSRALTDLLGDAAERARMGRNGRQRAKDLFDRTHALDALESLVFSHLPPSAVD